MFGVTWCLHAYANQFLDNYGVDADVTNILDNLDVYILPVYNVDGYEYTHTDVSYLMPCWRLRYHNTT